MTEWGVYRLWWRHRLLYVGKGSNGATDRIAAHRRKPWGGLIGAATWHPVTPNTEHEAFEVERAAIVDERPLANIVHQRRRGRRFGELVATATQPPATGPPPPPPAPKYWAARIAVAGELVIGAAVLTGQVPIGVGLAALGAQTAAGLALIAAETLHHQRN